ncbi:uncharacterized protein LOC108245779 isoform X2 [Kryptolebias marmoratus]|uniref:uncharacterized protein LOC108245779 isoform X2 n=1 Tax=Kryptolebias marmoratus TaxID=37003 RepID=UPI000D5309CA|nr:uncharacterized protein LOC108245779 isoform X2 [Kryptolebias marmoratus]
MSVCFFLLSLQVGNSTTEDEVIQFYSKPGEDFTVKCSFDSPGRWKIFCRENCDGGNLLIKTDQKTAQRGRYGTEYDDESFLSSAGLSVRISAVTRSDSGLYRCGLGDSSSSASFKVFRLFVADALLKGSSDHHLYKPAGSSLTVGCSFKFSGQRKSFCRGECEGDKILVETDGDRGQRGRCRIGYREGRFPVSSTFVYVTIEQLTRSDSGQYRCYLDRFLKDGFIDFRVTVIDALLDGDKVHPISKPAGSSLTVGCSFSRSERIKSFCRGECLTDLVWTAGDRPERDRYRIEETEGVLLVTIEQLTRSDSGRYRCYQDRKTKNSFREFEVSVTDASSSSASSSPTTTQTSGSFSGQENPGTSGGTSGRTPGGTSGRTPGGTSGGPSGRTPGGTFNDNMLLIVALTLTFIIILFSVVLLVFCRKRSAKAQKHSPVQTEYAAVSQTNRVYEDIREEGEQRRPLPVEVHTAYSYITYSKQAGAEPDDYSLVGAVTPAHKAQDDPSKLTYAEVEFSSSSCSPPRSSNRNQTDVIYSEAQLGDGSRAVDEPLYSNA